MNLSIEYSVSIQHIVQRYKPLRVNETMAHLLIKFGGGLITNKDKMMSANREAINNLAKTTSILLAQNHHVTIVHGAGSFGHLKAKKMRLALGADGSILNQQIAAVSEVRNDMELLNSIICQSLAENGIKTKSHPPSIWANGTGPDFEGDLTRFSKIDPNSINITFGDVVDCNEPKKFGILSGDDLMVRIAKEIEGISHVVFLLGDTEGVMTAPPNDPKAELIDTWKIGDVLQGLHQGEMDVTGGIFLKVNSAELIAQSVNDVWLIDGRKPERVIDLIENGVTIGTRVTA